MMENKGDLLNKLLEEKHNLLKDYARMRWHERETTGLSDENIVHYQLIFDKVENLQKEIDLIQEENGK